MPINFVQAQQAIRDNMKDAAEQARRQQDRVQEALGMLRAWAERGEELRDRAIGLNAGDKVYRCALPRVAAENSTEERLDAAISAPALPGAPRLIAADGSQIAPDRHAPVEFAAINIGAIQMAPGERPQEFTHTRLYFREALYTRAGARLSPETFDLQRDLEERQILAELACRVAIPAITLTDGPLEIYRDPPRMPGPDFKSKFTEFKKALSQLRACGHIVAGYVDKPGSDLALRLLELARPAEDGADVPQRYFKYLIDADVFSRVLEPGQRSAVFEIQSLASADFEGDLELHFFYLNVGSPERPYLARVEIPRWVADAPALLDRLHAALLEQCQVIGSRAYPYVLHRAHEIAIVSFDEKRQIETMIQQELMQRGLTPGVKSHKQFHKDSAKRTRYP